MRKKYATLVAEGRMKARLVEDDEPGTALEVIVPNVCLSNEGQPYDEGNDLYSLNYERSDCEFVDENSLQNGKRINFVPIHNQYGDEGEVIVGDPVVSVISEQASAPKNIFARLAEYIIKTFCDQGRTASNKSQEIKKKNPLNSPNAVWHDVSTEEIKVVDLDLGDDEDIRPNMLKPIATHASSKFASCVQPASRTSQEANSRNGCVLSWGMHIQATVSDERNSPSIFN